jgi:MFS family permease
VAQFAGRWYDRAGARAPASWGTALASAGMLLQAAGAWAISYPVMATGMFVLGLGIAFTMSPTNTDALGRVPNHERGQLSGLVQTMRQVGGSIGVATVAATVAASLDAPGMGAAPSPDDALRATAHAYAVGYAVASLGTIAAFVAVRRWMSPGRPAVTAAPAPAAP